MDPLSITAASLAFISAANATCDLITKFVDAPKVIEDAKGDLTSTIDSVHQLHSYLLDNSGTSLSSEAHLIKVLTAGKNKCDAFRTLLEGCSKHSTNRTDGKLSLIDRGKVLYKDKDIVAFRNELTAYRQAINVAAIPLLLYELCSDILQVASADIGSGLPAQSPRLLLRLWQDT